MPELAIIIVAYNTRRELDDCLRSLSSPPPVTPHEIVVVDNGSTDGTLEWLRASWPAVRAMAAGRNLGFAAGNNLGIRSTDAEYVVLLNSDTIVPEGALDTLVAALRSTPGIVAIAPRLVDGSGRPELSFGRMLGPLNELRQKTIGGLYAAGFGPMVKRVRRWTHTEGDHDWASGACLMVRRRDALRAGLLDERFFLYAEDVDFCSSLRALGGRIHFTPAAEVIHLRGRSGIARPEETERAYRQSQIAFYRKHHPRWLPWLRAYLRVRGKLPDTPA